MRRAGRYDARALLRTMDGVAAGAGSLFPGGNPAKMKAERRKLEDAAYPKPLPSDDAQ